MNPADVPTDDLTLEEKHGLERRCREFLDRKNSLSFKELCQLAEDAGFVFDRSRGSHVIYKHPWYMLDVRMAPSDRMNFQPDGSKAKPYQVADLVSFIRMAVRKG